MNELINLGNGQYVKVTMLKGEKGSNIATITKTETSGLTDTYTITLTDGSTTTFEVTNGSSIDHIEKTSTVGAVDTYTIYLTDGTVGGTFTVNNAIATVEQNFSTTSTNSLMNKTLTNIIAGVENGATASQTYNENDIILRNDSLYVVTTTVASGTAWADGVNIEEKTLGELIGTINTHLTASNDAPFRFGYDSDTDEYGYIVDEGGADTFRPFKDPGSGLRYVERIITRSGGGTDASVTVRTLSTSPTSGNSISETYYLYNSGSHSLKFGTLYYGGPWTYTFNTDVYVNNTKYTAGSSLTWNFNQWVDYTISKAE